jgi:hypothetical protein
MADLYIVTIEHDDGMLFDGPHLFETSKDATKYASGYVSRYTDEPLVAVVYSCMQLEAFPKEQDQ